MRVALKHWLGTPQWVMFLSALAGAACIWGAAVIAMRAPSLGVDLHAEAGGAVVTAVVPNGPSAGRLVQGDRIVALRTPKDERIAIDGSTLIADPDRFSTFADYNAFFHRQSDIYHLLGTPGLMLVLDDGREVRVNPLPHRPLRELGIGFWALSAFSLLVLELGVGMWAFRRDQFPPRLVAVTGIGYMISTLTFASYSTREWVLEPSLFWSLCELNHLGNLIFSYSALVLLWHYPTLLHRFPISRLLLVLVPITWFNELWQVVEWPIHTYYLQYFVPYLLGVWVAWRQWKNVRRQPDARAALQWVQYSALLSIGAVMLLYFVPDLFGAGPLVPEWGGQLMLSVFYLGLVLGVLRYRLFDLERWWFAAWMWFLGGILVFTLDVFLLYVTNLEPIGAISLAIIAAGWIYFPVRQWLWARFMRSRSLQLESYLPALLEAFFSATDSDAFEDRWERLMRQVFDPLAAREAPGICESTQLLESGMVLAIPDLKARDDRHLLLRGRSRGNRLFTEEDVHTASLVLALTRKAMGLRSAYERGAVTERERIARDLHDDVAPHLLSLIHRASTDESAEGARSALQTLRESIYALNDPRDKPLDEVLSEWRRETADRIEAAGFVELEWNQPEENTAWTLNSRQRVNLARVLREGVTNALRHARPAHLAVTVRIVEQWLMVRMSHDGLIIPLADWLPGNGIANMRVRIDELDGDIRWDTECPPGSPVSLLLHVTWQVPLTPQATPL